MKDGGPESLRGKGGVFVGRDMLGLFGGRGGKKSSFSPALVVGGPLNGVVDGGPLIVVTGRGPLVRVSSVGGAVGG